MKFIIGVDAGGTKTEAVVYDEQGNVVKQAITGFGNLLVHFDEAMSNLTKAIDTCTEGLSMADCAGIYLGVAGIESGNLRQIVDETLSAKYGVYVESMNDAFIAHAALLQGDNGVLTIAGTGSIALAMKDGVAATAGGWGHLLGDEGSGYWISVAAFKAMIADEDEGKPVSSLSKKILDELGVSKVGDIIGFIYNEPKASIAKFVPIVVEEAKLGNEIAIRVLTQAGEDLAHTTIQAARKLGVTTNVKIGLRGGILTNVSFVNEPFMTSVKEAFNDATFVSEDVSSTKGAYYLGKEKIMN
ncbi:N-acetylglucosamine kinase [Priestia taiwanensis]|uniref:ATPase n=1 Tax=Priestia taiwanensis TaxID=1347902 RepID=A0A917ARG3_9BACI|nr:BadF/BadG/BcrA/BcrD ATPase family protein [Priestia taiwanensis]MBM7363872.1 N-acetylglucosamine kinase-like BadF-type ATPase [Priestia taiwanensis]GGE69692.1 ATPase [Priestia taiwanensis]